MIILDRLSETTTLSELNQQLLELSSQWEASQALYLKYDELNQTLNLNQQSVALSSDNQPGLAALTLRPVDSPELPWPFKGNQEHDPHMSYRTSIPIMHWGSLSAVLTLGFKEKPQPEINKSISEVVSILGVIGYEVDRREQQETFLLRTREFLVHAVEAQGRAGHVERCSRVATALAAMLDCSSQSKAELMMAAQYHDIGLLSFSKPQSPTAIREHALRGAKLLEAHPELRTVAILVESHHERYDGSGVPLGKKGSELSLEAWILALTEDLVENWEGQMGTFSERIRPFFTDEAKRHHPDVVDALCGLVDAEKLENLLVG